MSWFCLTEVGHLTWKTLPFYGHVFIIFYFHGLSLWMCFMTWEIKNKRFHPYFYQPQPSMEMHNYRGNSKNRLLPERDGLWANAGPSPDIWGSREGVWVQECFMTPNLSQLCIPLVPVPGALWVHQPTEGSTWIHFNNLSGYKPIPLPPPHRGQ